MTRAGSDRAGEAAQAGSREPGPDAPGGPAARAPAEPAIRLQDLVRRYGERPALAGVTITVPQGATLAVLGANGAGKTTLLRILAALLRPHSGTAHVLGAELPKEAWKTRGRVGYLGHESLLYRDLTVRQNLDFHARLHRVEKPRVTEVLEQVGLTRRAHDPIQELSRGLLQRAAVARATLHDPDVLLLDEPRANLDPNAAAALEPLIGRASNKTRVLVSHDARTALQEADFALTLKDGRQHFAGPADQADTATLYA